MDSSSSYVDLHETLEIDSDDLRISEEINDLTIEKLKSNNEYTILKKINKETQQIKEKKNTDEYECQSESVVNDDSESFENNQFCESDSDIVMDENLKVEQISGNINSSDQSFNCTDTSNCQNGIEDDLNQIQKVNIIGENILSQPEEQNFEQQVSSKKNMMLEHNNKINDYSENSANHERVNLELNCSSIIDKNIAKDDVSNFHNIQPFENNEKNDKTGIKINQTQSIMLENEKYDCLNSEQIEQKLIKKDQNDKYDIEFDMEKDQQYSDFEAQSFNDAVKNEKIIHAKYLENNIHIRQKFNSEYKTEENTILSKNDRSQIKIDDITESNKDQTKTQKVEKKEFFQENKVYSNLNDLNFIVEKSNKSSNAIEKEKIEENIEFLHDQNEIDNQNIHRNNIYLLKKEFKSFSENSIQYITKQQNLQMQRTIDEKCESDNSVKYSFSDFVNEMKQSKISDRECQIFSDMIIKNDKDAIKNNNSNIIEKQKLKKQQNNRTESLFKSNQKINPKSKRMENVSNFQKKSKKDVNDANIDADLLSNYNFSSENPTKDEIDEEQIIISKKQTDIRKMEETNTKEILPSFLVVDELHEVDKMSDFRIENEKTDNFHIIEKSCEFDSTKSEKMDFNCLNFDFSQLPEAPIEFYNDIEDKIYQHLQKKNTNISTSKIFGGNETTTENELQDDVSQATEKSILKDSDQKMDENEKEIKFIENNKAEIQVPDEKLMKKDADQINKLQRQKHDNIDFTFKSQNESEEINHNTSAKNENIITSLEAKKSKTNDHKLDNKSFEIIDDLPNEFFEHANNDLYDQFDKLHIKDTAQNFSQQNQIQTNNLEDLFSNKFEFDKDIENKDLSIPHLKTNELFTNDHFSQKFTKKEMKTPDKNEHVNSEDNLRKNGHFITKNDSNRVIDRISEKQINVKDKDQQYTSNLKNDLSVVNFRNEQPVFEKNPENVEFVELNNDKKYEVNKQNVKIVPQIKDTPKNIFKPSLDTFKPNKISTKTIPLIDGSLLIALLSKQSRIINNQRIDSTMYTLKHFKIKQKKFDLEKLTKIEIKKQIMEQEHNDYNIYRLLIEKEEIIKKLSSINEKYSDSEMIDTVIKESLLDNLGACKKLIKTNAFDLAFFISRGHAESEKLVTNEYVKKTINPTFHSLFTFTTSTKQYYNKQADKENWKDFLCMIVRKHKEKREISDFEIDTLLNMKKTNSEQFFALLIIYLLFQKSFFMNYTHIYIYNLELLRILEYLNVKDDEMQKYITQRLKTKDVRSEGWKSYVERGLSKIIGFDQTSLSNKKSDNEVTNLQQIQSKVTNNELKKVQSNENRQNENYKNKNEKIELFESHLKKTVANEEKTMQKLDYAASFADFFSEKAVSPQITSFDDTEMKEKKIEDDIIKPPQETPSWTSSFLGLFGKKENKKYKIKVNTDVDYKFDPILKKWVSSKQVQHQNKKPTQITNIENISKPPKLSPPPLINVSKKQNTNKNDQKSLASRYVLNTNDQDEKIDVNNIFGVVKKKQRDS